ncbi:MAG: GMP synthase (glutamine-hydrolysing) [Rhodobacteraceae bacterium HLUCCA08]|nr:MAG: GMP synthase (glutamine-hydrolysing) [Rhodobacteraceae bacterium HLUCCA08]
MKTFLILQLRPETDASDDEFAAILAKGGLTEGDVHRIRLDQGDPPEALDPADYAGTIVGGGPGCVSDPAETKSPLDARMEAACFRLLARAVADDLPFLGCCYGIGILAHHLGGTVSKARYGEPVGTSPCALTPEGAADPLLAGLPARFDAFVGHKEAVQALPPGCVHLVESGPCPFQMIRHGRNVYATQFHPEADADGFETRIRIYRDYGYFPPETAQDLVAMCRAADVTAPEGILRNFVQRYG